MKKLLSAALAAAMVLGMGTTAFAAVTTGTHALYIDVDSGTELIPGVTYTYDVRRVYNDTDRYVSRDVMSSLDYDIEVNHSELDDRDISVSIRASGDSYVAQVRASSSLREEDYDNVEIIITTYDDDDDIKLGESLVQFDVRGAYNYTSSGEFTVYEDEILLMEFDTDVEEVAIEFDDYAIYEGQFTGSRKKTLSFDTEENDDILDDNPDAEIEFYNFPNAASLKYGQLTIYSELEYVYERSGDSLKRIDAKIDSQDEEVIIRTDTLDDYVLSDIPLETDADYEDDDVDEPDDDNTSTSTSTSSSKVSLTSSIINNAKRSGSYAIVNTTENAYTSGTDLVNAGKYLKTGEQLILRYVDDGAVQHQWYFDAKNAAYASSSLKLGMTKNYQATETFFEKYFSNDVEVLKTDHVGNLGVTANIAVKMDLSDLNTNTLRAYMYYPSSNSYLPMSNTNIRVDAAGYLRMSISEGGYIVITDAALS